MPGGTLVGVIAVLLTASPAADRGAAEDVRFTAGPSARPVAGGVRIEFAVNRPIDVAVRILDAQGRPIRHLAAGLLGANPPAPLEPDSLRQSLLWDLPADRLLVPAAGKLVRLRIDQVPPPARRSGANPPISTMARSRASSGKDEERSLHDDR